MELKICPDGQNKGFGLKSGKRRVRESKAEAKGRWWRRKKNNENDIKKWWRESEREGERERGRVCGGEKETENNCQGRLEREKIKKCEKMEEVWRDVEYKPEYSEIREVYCYIFL